MIRPYTEKDAPAVMDLWLRANLDAHAFIPAAYWKDQFDDVEKEISKAEVYVCEEKGILCGFLGLVGTFLAGLFVAKGQRSKGIGTRLLNRAKAVRSRLDLGVYVKNEAAVRFYRREGFDTKEVCVDPQTGEREYRMHWDAQNEA